MRISKPILLSFSFLYLSVTSLLVKHAGTKIDIKLMSHNGICSNRNLKEKENSSVIWGIYFSSSILVKFDIQNTSRYFTLSHYVLSVSYKKITDPVQCDWKYCPNIDISKTKRNGTDPEKGCSCKKRKVVANFHHEIPKLIRICYSLKNICQKCTNICRLFKLIV